MMINFRVPPYNFEDLNKLTDLSQLIKFWKRGELLQQVVFNTVLYQGYSGETQLKNMLEWLLLHFSTDECTRLLLE